MRNMMLKFDDKILLSNDYMRRQINDNKHCKLSKRKKLPHKELHMWKYNRMHQKDIFSEPLVHGMCNDLQSTYKAEFLREEEDVALEISQEVAALNLNELPREALDLNEIDQEDSAFEIAQEDAGVEIAQEDVALEIAQEVAALDLNELPREALDLNEIAQEDSAFEIAQEDADFEIAQEDADFEIAQEDADFEIAQEDADLDAQEEDAIDQEENHANVQHSTTKKVNLSNEKRYGVYFALAVIRSRDGQVVPEDKMIVASLLNTTLRTIERIWEEANKQLDRGEKVDVSSKMKGRVGRKKKDLELERIVTVPSNKRKTIRALSRSLGVSRSTLHERFLLGEVVRHTSTMKPVMSETNKIGRLKFGISFVDMNSLMFQKMNKIVHLDEKWFDMTKVKNTYYLLPGEPLPLRTGNRQSIGKVMFLAAVARPRYGADGEVTFDGKIGIWPFVIETPAKRKSRRRKKGTLELKSQKVTRDVMRTYLCEKVIPAIQDVWPDEDEGSTIFIQQDNAKPHVLPNDEGFAHAVEQTDLDIRLMQQPPNSPDMNVLDLSLFRSLQSHTDTRAPKDIRDLIEGVEQEFLEYDVDTLERSFLTLQACMIEVMKRKGGIDYDPPHMKKDQMLPEERHGLALPIPAELLAETIALIEAAPPEPPSRQKKGKAPATSKPRKVKKKNNNLQEATEAPSEHHVPPRSNKNRNLQGEIPLVTCVPTKVVFSRIMEALSRPSQALAPR